MGIYTKSNQNQRYPLATASVSNTVTRRIPGYTQKRNLIVIAESRLCCHFALDSKPYYKYNTVKETVLR